MTKDILHSENGTLILSAAFVQELLGGTFPDSGTSRHYPSGFAWDQCEYRVEDGRLVPYAGGLPAPGPDLRLVIAEEGRIDALVSLSEDVLSKTVWMRFWPCEFHDCSFRSSDEVSDMRKRSEEPSAERATSDGDDSRTS